MKILGTLTWWHVHRGMHHVGLTIAILLSPTTLATYLWIVLVRRATSLVEYREVERTRLLHLKQISICILLLSLHTYTYTQIKKADK